MTGPRYAGEAQRPIHILLAEDDANDQTLFCTAVSKAQLNVQVHIVDHGHEVVEYLEGIGAYADRRTHPVPDVLVLDLRMPLMDGFEVLDWCHRSAACRSLPIVALSGSMDERWANRALGAGATRFFLKSFRLANWMAMVRDIAELARGQSPEPRSLPAPQLMNSVSLVAAQAG